MRAQSSPHRGYSLVELAIVLGIVGTIAGLIWGYANTAYEKVRRQQMLQEVRTVVENIRGSFTGQMGIPNLGVSGMVPFLVQNHAIPQEMVRTPYLPSCTNNGNICADTPWGMANAGGNAAPLGTFRVCDWVLGQISCFTNATPGTSQAFALIIVNLPIGACMQLAEKISGPDGPPGLADVNINGCNILASTGCVSPPTPSFPIASKDLVNLCTLPNSTNSLRFVYRLRLPQN